MTKHFFITVILPPLVAAIIAFSGIFALDFFGWFDNMPPADKALTGAVLALGGLILGWLISSCL